MSNAIDVYVNGTVGQVMLQTNIHVLWRYQLLTFTN